MNTQNRYRHNFRSKSVDLPRPHDSAIHSTCVGPVNTNLYGDGLQKLCARTQNNMKMIAQTFAKMDPCLKFGMKHWHPENRPKTANNLHKEKAQPPDPDKVKWHDTNVMFTSSSAIKSLGNKQQTPASVKDDETSSVMSQSTGQQISFCYLCSTLEEHQRHLLQHRTKRPHTAKPRIEYIAPKPRVKRKEPEEKEILVHENLYKVDVFTGDVNEAGTTANVFITIKGSRSVLDKTELTKNRGSTNFCFVRGSKETFFLKGPKLGNLEIVTIEHNGLEKKHGWYLEKIEITDMTTENVWTFWCKQWLSIHIKDFQIRRDLYGKEREQIPHRFDIEVITGKKSMSGTDANIYITLFGKKGVSSKIHLADKTKGKTLFEKGQTDKFAVAMKDLGELKKLRIEHDGKGFASGWYLDRITVTTHEPKEQTYYFLYSGWIARDVGDGQLYRDIPAKKNLQQVKEKGTTTTYTVSVRTGDVRYAGTDANVFIQMCGANAMTNKIKLDDAKNNFERAMLDEFKLDAIDVGPLSHIIVGHDNSGPGAGWFLDEVKIRRYLQKHEIKQFMKKAKKKLSTKEKQRSEREQDRLKKGMRESLRESKDGRRESLRERRDERRESLRESKNHRKESLWERRHSLRYGNSISEEEDESEEEDSDEDLSDDERKRRLRNRRRSKAGRRDDEDIDTQRIPMYEEYLFQCKKWLAKDEGDGLCVRELKVKDKKLYFRD